MEYQVALPPRSAMTQYNEVCPCLIGHASPAYLFGLESIVNATPGMRVDAAVRSRQDLFARCSGRRTGIVLVQEGLGNQSIDSQVRELEAAAPELRVVLMLAAPLPGNARMSIETSALGVVAQHDDVQVFRNALAAVALKRRFISSLVAEQLAISLTATPLTMREMGVLERLSQGKCNKEIARDLAIACGTVKSHLHTIMGKLNVSSRTEVLLKASDLGILRL